MKHLSEMTTQELQETFKKVDEGALELEFPMSSEDWHLYAQHTIDMIPEDKGQENKA